MAERTAVNDSPQRSSKKLHPCRYEGCNSLFKKPSHLSRHELIHNDERPYVCTFPKCDKAFRSQCHLKRHETIHGQGKLFKCDFENCDVSCITEWNLKRHIKRTHCGLFKCKKCDKEFKKNKLLKQHISLEHKATAICCEFPGCAQIFKVAAKMRHHMKVHTGKGYACPVKDCSLTFKLWSECRLHTAECKKKEKQCEVCGKTFTQHANLKAHMKVHSEEREVFQCTYDGCGRFYTKHYNLKVHIQSYHQNIRPYVCPKAGCHKSFHFQHLLRRHLEHHAQNDEKEEQQKPPSRKRARRMFTSVASGVTGYIPELWQKMTPEEIKDYLLNDNSHIVDTDVLPRDSETTQVEMTPIPSSEIEDEVVEEQTMNGDDDATEMQVVELNDVHVVSSEETLTAITTESEAMDADLSVVYQPLKSLEEACIYLNQRNNFERNSSSPLISSSTNSSRPASACSGEDGSRLTKLVGERIKQIVEQRSQSNIPESCHMQSVTESDSSDSESKKNLQLAMQQCAS